MSAKLIEVTIKSRDVARTTAFYRLLGVPCGDIGADGPGDPPHVHAVWGKWAPGSDDFLMLNIIPADGTPAPLEIGFATDDLEGLHATLIAAGVEVMRAPEGRPWGTVASYRDPDGNTVSISQRPQ